MLKTLKIMLWGLGILILLSLVFILFSPVIGGWLLAPDHEFGTKPIPAAPDYSLRSHWAAWPDDSSPAERLPEGIDKVPQEDRLAEAFFLHPTTYGGNKMRQ